MISPTESLPLASARKHRKTLDAYDLATRRYFLEVAHRFCAPLPSQEPFDWCVDNVVFADTEVTGPFNPVGREFLRDIINDIDDTENREHTVICATGTGKTTSVMCRHHWTIVHNPRRAIMVMPATKGAGGSETYVTSRFIPSLEATRATRELMPDGQRRLFMNSKKVRINGSHFDFVGGGSPSAVASNRCSLIEIDELDKLKDKLGNEAGTKKLVDERTEGVKDYTVFQSTTPTVETAQGWKSLLRSDFRRRFLPCPHCNPTASKIGQRGTEATEQNSNIPGIAPLGDLCVSVANLKGWFDLAWSEQYCVLPTKFHNGVIVPRAFIKWDDEAKRKDGEWDRDRIVRSVRLECPHCQGHIRDEHKVWMDKNGVWIPLQENHGHKGYHLSALYAPPLVTRDEDPTHKSRLAGRALKFLDATADGEGMKGFINSTLAEVDMSQEHSAGTIKLSSTPLAQPDWVSILTADFHKNAPYIWFTVRKWCAFKLLPPVGITDGLPEFVPLLDLPGNEAARAKCAALLDAKTEDGRWQMADGKFRNGWNVIAELYRFKSSDVGESPIFDFLIAQKITGDKLVKLFRGDADGSTLEFRRIILARMFELEHGTMSPEEFKKFRAPRGGDSELIAAGNLDTSGPRLWQDLRDLEIEFKVGQGLTLDRRAVFIDCGFQEKYDAEVLRESYERATWFKWYQIDSPKHAPLFNGVWERGQNPPPARGLCVPCAATGWLPLQGIPTARPQGDGKISRDLSMRVADPFYGTGQQEGTRVIEVLRVPQMLFWHRRQELREGRTKNTWTISPNVSWFPKHYLPDGSRSEESSYRIEDFQKQSDGQYWDERTKKVEPKGGRGGSQSKRNPYHVDDCEVYQVAGATHLEFFEAQGAAAKT